MALYPLPLACGPDLCTWPPGGGGGEEKRERDRMKQREGRERGKVRSFSIMCTWLLGGGMCERETHTGREGGRERHTEEERGRMKQREGERERCLPPTSYKIPE